MSSRFDRQTFLGPGAQSAIQGCHVGVLGLGGGGSHIVQQLAHLGFRRLTLFDPDLVENVNLNRLVGATEFDARWNVPKVAVAERTVRSLEPGADIVLHRSRWQDVPLALRDCDLIFSCLDNFRERREAEATCRRFLIPLLDIGIDVHAVEGEPPQLGGQVIASVPGEPCMTCLGFLTEAKLAAEAARYGSAGPRPQVVWANGVVASTAVGLAVALVTGWSGPVRHLYLSFDANTGTVCPHPRLSYLDLSAPCPHFPATDVGEPRLHRV